MKKIFTILLFVATYKAGAQSSDSSANRFFFLSSAAIGLPVFSGSASLDNGWQFASGLEYKFGKNSSLAGDVSFDTYGYKKAGDGYNLKGSAGLTSVQLFYKQSFGQGRWQPFVRIGGGGARLSLPTVTVKSGVAAVEDKAQIVGIAGGEAGLLYCFNGRYTFLAAVGHQWTGTVRLLDNKAFQITGLKLGFLTPF